MSALVAVGEAVRAGNGLPPGMAAAPAAGGGAFPAGFVATGAAAGPAAFGDGDHGQRLTTRNGCGVVGRNSGRRRRYRSRQRLTARRRWRVGRRNGGRRGRQRLSAWNDGSGRLRDVCWRRDGALGLRPRSRKGGGGRTACRWRNRKRLQRLARSSRSGVSHRIRWRRRRGRRRWRRAGRFARGGPGAAARRVGRGARQSAGAA